MAKSAGTGKRDLIGKTNSKMVATVAIAAFLSVFSLIAARALWSQRGYQSRVIGEKEKAVSQLEENIKAVEELEVSYRAFVETQDNVIGGNSQALGDRDGDNAKIVLDALPSKYDYPALITSMEKLLAENNFTLKSIGGQDDEIAQAESSSAEPVMVPFSLTSEVGNYVRVNELLQTLYRSIRPIHYKNLNISGSGESALEVSVDGFTYYQPSKEFKVDTKVVK
ncbi:hypothetical protein KC950_00975 [Candidatus Saccharibacteria bacterium]|nr:hypothetical protein [Candidatus Saccharibacteria bacterium]